MQITSVCEHVTEFSLILLFLLSPVLPVKLNHFTLDEKYVGFLFGPLQPTKCSFGKCRELRF